jgi:hypothetical protein
MSPWTLVQEDRYAEAVVAFTGEHSIRPSELVLNNRGMAHLHLGDCAAALSDFEAAVEQHNAESLHLRGGGPGVDRTMSGVALWMAGRFPQALATWTADVEARLAGASRYGDAAGGVTAGNVLLFAGARLANRDAQKLAVKSLRKRLRAKQSAAWPGPVSRYLLEKLSEADLVAAVSQVPILHERQMCQARFYVGVKGLLEGDRMAYRRAVQEAYEFGRVAKLECEYYLAMHEIRSE